MLNKIKLLVVEDDLPQTFLIKESLDENIFEISNIEDGLEALDYLLTTDNVPDIILMDYHLPSIDGISILNKLKEDGKKYNVVFLTADYSIETAIQSLTAGALDFIPKDGRFVKNLPAIIDKVYQTVKARKEREEFEHALQESEARFKVVMEASKDGIFEWNFKEKRAQISPNIAYMLGYSLDEMPGNLDLFLELVHPDDREPLIKNYQEHLKLNATICEKEIRLKAKNGSYKWILHRGIIAEKDKLGTPLTVIGTHADITERKLTEEKIIYTNRRLSTLISNLPGIVYSCNNADFFQKDFLGGRVEEITGYKNVELISKGNKTFEDVVHPDDKFDVLNLIIQAIANKTDFEIYYRIITKKGDIRWVWDHGTLIYDQLGEIISIEGYITDITEKKLYDEALQKSEEEKNIILDNSLQVFILLDITGHIVAFNKIANHRAIIMIGKTLKQGGLIFDFVSEAEKKNLKVSFKKACAGEPVNWENLSEYRNNISWYDNIMVPVFISRDEIKFVCYTSIDITERKIAQEKILSSENLYNTTINSLNDYIYVVDEKLNLILVNDAVLRFNSRIGITGDILYKNLFEVYPFLQASGEEPYADLFKTGKEYILENNFNFNGKIYNVEIKLNPIIEQKKVVRIVSIARDITERKNFEKRIMNTIIETEEKERKRFSEDLHDGLGSILSTIKIYINTLYSENIAPDKRNELTQFTNQLIDEAIQNSKEVANNLSPNVIKRFGLISAISSLCEKIQTSSDITINFDAQNFKHKLPEDKELSIYRIISELINNTIKHSGANQADILITSYNNNIQINYCDNGKGFNFEQRLEDKSKGLGLHNITGRVNYLNGTYKIDDKPGGFAISFEFQLAGAYEK